MFPRREFLVRTPWNDGRAKHFFYDEVLARDESIDDGIGPARWWLVIGLTLNWLLCYACVFAGAESAGKAIWITLPLPYVLLFVLLVKGASLPGAGEGLRFYLGSWDWSKLGDGEAWVDGVAQIFFGLSIACGSMPAYASNCSRSENVGRNTWTVGVANSATSVFAGFVVFCFLGHLAHVQGVTVPEVAEGGWGLAFVVYPTAMALFGHGAGQFFAACFWLTLLSLGVDSAFALIEAAICAACDRVPWCARNRRVTAALACFACWLVGLPMCTGGGYQVVDVMDAYVSRYTLIIAGLLECVFVGHWYGADRLQDEARAACGHGVGGRFFRTRDQVGGSRRALRHALLQRVAGIARHVRRISEVDHRRLRMVPVRRLTPRSDHLRRRATSGSDEGIRPNGGGDGEGGGEGGGVGGGVESPRGRRRGTERGPRVDGDGDVSIERGKRRGGLIRFRFVSRPRRVIHDTLHERWVYPRGSFRPPRDARAVCVSRAPPRPPPR